MSSPTEMLLPRPSGRRMTLSAELARSIAYLALLIGGRLLLQLALSSQGFISVSADEFTRGLRAARWALQPRLDLAVDFKGTWLPLEKYLNGSLLLVWPDPIVVPRVTTFIASCLVLIELFILTYYLFHNFSTAALAALLVVVQPWYVWLSGTPMLEMYYLACFLGGMVFLVVWLREARRGYWLWAGCCFMLASCFHVQAWPLVNLVNVVLLIPLGSYVARRDVRRSVRVLGLYLVSNLFIIGYALYEFVTTGHLFGFLAAHTAYSKAVYQGYDVSAWEKLLYYPQVILRNSSEAAWLLLLCAVICLVRDRVHRWAWLPLITAELVLLVNSVLNVWSVPATAAPDRYSLLYGLLFTPYLAYGVWRLWRAGKQRLPGLAGAALIALSALLFLYTLGWGALRIPAFPRGEMGAAMRAGTYLDQVLNQEKASRAVRYMVEVRYWDFLAVELLARHYNDVVFDREQNNLKRDQPSLLKDIPDRVYARLLEQQVGYVVLHDLDLKTAVRQMSFLRPLQDIEGWTIYEFAPTPR